MKIKENLVLDFLEKSLIKAIGKLPLDMRVSAINRFKVTLSRISPFASEPVDCVIWVKGDQIEANSYNPNSVAPPEMKLLEQSILQDGYTQPIVAWKKEGKYEVVDGFHRNRVGKECNSVRERVQGYLPLTIINQTRTDIGDRMVSTIRHNRARGKHNVESMSDIVVELKKRNWTEEKISKNLGMEVDEILRLCQISGLTEMFKDQDFSKSWDVDFSQGDSIGDADDESLMLEEGSDGSED
jgi:ParB-like chromosome segregation protein Spo0J